MNILIAGGTGFIGKAITRKLHKQGHHVLILTRTPEVYENSSNTTYLHYDNAELPEIQVIINLAGDSLFGYWTNQKKEAIVNSRIDTTEKLIQLMEQMKQKPNVFINGSAIGFYGTNEKSMFSEETIQPGNDFLANVVVQWEKAASQAEKLGIRTVYARFGVVLGARDGALQMMSLPVKLFAGGNIGSGEQWLSWIHIEDVARLVIFCTNNHQISGPVNVTSPAPMRNKDFMKALAKTLKRPYYLRTPASLVRIATGEMSMLITKGQYVLPKKALDHDFNFLYPHLQEALNEIYDKS